MFCFTKEIEYTYDVFGRRIKKSIDDDGAGPNPAEEIQYIYDGFRSDRGNAGDHIILAFDGDDALTNRYLHGPDVDQVLADEQVPAGDLFWMLADNLGSIRDVVDNDGTVLNHIKYDSFGNITSESDDTVDVIFGYTGRERDEESDLQYNRARYYDARVGRWISEDPIGFLGGDTNLNRYVGNGVTNATDPSGLQPPESKPKKPDKMDSWPSLKEQAEHLRWRLALYYARKWQELKWKEQRQYERDLITSVIHDSLHTACWGGTYAKQLHDEIKAIEKEAFEQQKINIIMLLDASEYLQITGQLTKPIPPTNLVITDIGVGPGGPIRAVKGLKGLLAVLKGLRTFTFRGALRLDSLRSATHAIIAKAFKGTGLKPSGHFIKRLRDARLEGCGLRSFKDLESIIRHGRTVVQDDGTVALVRNGVAIIINPKTKILITITPWR